MNTLVHRLKVLGVLAVPLLAIAVALVIFAGGSSSTVTTQAAGAAPDMDLTVANAATFCDDALKPTKCTFSDGDGFTVIVQTNVAPTAPIAGYQTEVAGFDAGELIWNMKGTCNNEVDPKLAGSLVCARGVGPNGEARHATATGVSPPLTAYAGVTSKEAHQALVSLNVECPTDPASSYTLTLNEGGSFGATYFGADLAPIAVDDTDGVEDLEINCLPPPAQINVNITDSDDPGDKKVPNTCVLFMVNNLLASPALVNAPIDVVSDNNSIPACDTVGPFMLDLTDTNPAVGTISVTISAAFRAQFGDEYHALQVATNKKYTADFTKNVCDFALPSPNVTGSKCLVELLNDRHTGNLNVTFVENPGDDPITVPEQCVEVYDDPPANTSLVETVCDSDDGALDGAITGHNLVNDVYSVDYVGPFISAAHILSTAGAKEDDAKADCDLVDNQKCTFIFAQQVGTPAMLKSPALANLWLTNQPGPKLGAACQNSTDVVVLNEIINNPVTSLDPKGSGNPQKLAAFEFELRFKTKNVCVNIKPGTAAANMICFVSDKDSSLLEGIARIACVTQKGQPFPDTTTPAGRHLATIQIRPTEEMYSLIIANQENGAPTQILDQDCELSDQLGHPIEMSSKTCADADVTIRWLEGDVNGSGTTDAASDCQILAFRWGAEFGNLLYNQRYDLEPSADSTGAGVNGDGDIDVKDIQFCFGRHGSTTANPNPPQPPVNPKAQP